MDKNVISLMISLEWLNENWIFDTTLRLCSFEEIDMKESEWMNLSGFEWINFCVSFKWVRGESEWIWGVICESLRVIWVIWYIKIFFY